MPTEGLRQRAPRSPRTKAEMEAWSKETLAETLGAMLPRHGVNHEEMLPV